MKIKAARLGRALLDGPLKSRTALRHRCRYSSMAAATQATVFLGTLSSILHVFRIFPSQANAKVAAHALFAALTVLLVFVSLAAGRFDNAWVGVLAFAAAAASLVMSFVIYRNEDPNVGPSLVAGYAVLQMTTLVLVMGSAGLGLFH